MIEINEHLAVKVRGWHKDKIEPDGLDYWFAGKNPASLQYCVGDWDPFYLLNQAMDCANCLSLTHRVAIKLVDEKIKCQVFESDARFSWGDNPLYTYMGPYDMAAGIITRAIAGATGFPVR